MNNVSDFFKSRMKGQTLDPPSHIWEQIDNRMGYQEQEEVPEQEAFEQEEMQEVNNSIKVQD